MKPGSRQTRSLCALIAALAAVLAIDLLACGVGAADPSEPDARAATHPKPTTAGISRAADAAMAAGPPGVVEVTDRAAITRAEGAGTRDDTISGYRILRRCAQGPWLAVSLAARHDDDPRNRGRYQYEEEEDEEEDADCEYALAAVSEDGRPGPTHLETQLSDENEPSIPINRTIRS